MGSFDENNRGKKSSCYNLFKLGILTKMRLIHSAGLEVLCHRYGANRRLNCSPDVVGTCLAYGIVQVGDDMNMRLDRVIRRGGGRVKKKGSKPLLNAGTIACVPFSNVVKFSKVCVITEQP
jgi:hypothetical protein